MVELLDRQTTEDILREASAKTVLVIGDLMLDEYIWGDAERISPEAPVPVVRWEDRTIAPGGAANVVNNVIALGAQVVVAGVVGEDRAGRRLIDQLEQAGACVDGVVVTDDRPTTRKIRIFARGQQMLRLDQETAAPLTSSTETGLLDRIRGCLSSVDLVLFSDYAKGCLGHALVREVIAKARGAGRWVTAGPKPNTLSVYAGCTLMSFNRLEAQMACDFPVRDRPSVERAGTQLIGDLQTDAIAITRGGEGTSLFCRGKQPIHVPAHPIKVFDECGAGDTFLTATSLALCSGRPMETAVAFGNLAAAVAVSHVGVVPVPAREILELYA